MISADFVGRAAQGYRTTPRYAARKELPTPRFQGNMRQDTTLPWNYRYEGFSALKKQILDRKPSTDQTSFCADYCSHDKPCAAIVILGQKKPWEPKSDIVVLRQVGESGRWMTVSSQTRALFEYVSETFLASVAPVRLMELYVRYLCPTEEA